jgi:hypothetical protein
LKVPLQRHSKALPGGIFAQTRKGNVMRSAIGQAGSAILLVSASVACSGGEFPGHGDGEIESIGVIEQALGPASNDLDVGFIQRLPSIDYVENSPNPKVQGWPAVGQNVTWRAHVHNFSTSARTVNYAWTYDGASVKTGSVTLPAGSTTPLDYARAWAFERHQLRLAIDTGNSFAEIEENNNALTVFTDALSVGFYVEQSLYDYFNAHQRELVGAGSNSWDDWAQRQIKRWNDIHAAAVYPGDAPNGVLDRVRLDKITVVPDAALPLVPGWLPTNNPNPNDRTIDMQWGFPRTLLDGSFYTSREVSDANAFYYEGSLIHEELHARYLLDNYGFNVHALAGGGGRDRIDPLENGASIVGTPFLPMVSSDAVYFTDELGMMNGDHSFMDRYGAMALNRIAGHRAVSGNMNAPGNFAIFINDLPADNELTLVDGAGAPLGGAGVRIYRSTPGSNGFYSKWFDATADFTGTADGAGKLRVGRNPFSSSALDGWHGSTIALMRVAHAGRVRYVFLEAADFNKEYWRGRTSLGLHTISVPFSTAPARSVPSRVQAEDYDRFFDSTAGNTGGGCRTGDVDLELTGDAGGGCNIGWTTAGEWVEFDVQTATTQTFDIVSRVASANAGKTFRIEVDGVAVGGTQTAPNSGWQSFQNRVVSGVTLSAGSHRIRVVFITGDVNLNYLDVVLSPGVLIPSRIEAESYVRFLDSTTGNSGNACRTDNVDVQTTTDPNGGVCNIGWTTAGEWLEYDVRVATTRTFSIVARLAAATTGRTIHLEIDGVNVGTLTAPSGGFQAFQDRTLSGINIAAGTHRVRVVFDTGSVNLNYITFN